RALVTQLEVMGQHLFAPPNVKGWEGASAWLNTATVVARHNLAHAMTLGGGELNLGDPEISGVAVAVDPSHMARRARIEEPEALVAFYADLLVQGDLSKAARERLVAFLTEGQPERAARERRVREMIHALVTIPEYQLA